MSDHVILTKTKNRTKIYFILKYAQNKKKKKMLKLLRFIAPRSLPSFPNIRLFETRSKWIRVGDERVKKIHAWSEKDGWNARGQGEKLGVLETKAAVSSPRPATPPEIIRLFVGKRGGKGGDENWRRRDHRRRRWLYAVGATPPKLRSSKLTREREWGTN